MDLRIIGFALIASLATAQDPRTSHGYYPNRALLDPEIAQIPDDILICYSDRELWDRYSRLPSSIGKNK